MKALFLALVASSAFAQYEGPAVQSCREYAIKDLKRAGADVKDAVIESDRQLLIARYTRKVGSQFVSSVLSGNGSIVYPEAAAAELSFVCLLADDKHPVFFACLPRPDASSLAPSPVPRHGLALNTIPLFTPTIPNTAVGSALPHCGYDTS